MGSEFGDFVKARREELGLTQKQVANLIGVSRGHISQIETDTIPSDEVLTKLLLLLKVPLDQMLLASDSEQVAPEYRMILEQFAPMYRLLEKYLEPHEYLEVMLAQRQTTDLVMHMFESATNMQFDAPPEGWTTLTKGDRKLVQQVINRLLATKRYEEGE